MNAAKQESTKLAPFKVDIGRIPTRPLIRSLGDLNGEHETAADFIERQKAFSQAVKDHLLAARKSQRYFADRNRKDRNFKQGDWVVLQSQSTHVNTRADLPEKWHPRFMGRVEVIEKVGDVS